MRAVIVGMGIGQVYKEQMDQRKWQVVTVDPKVQSNFDSVGSFDTYYGHEEFDLGIVAVPNESHYSVASALAKRCRVVLIEKPGLQTVDAFETIKRMHPDTFFVIAKNNMYRENLNPFFAFLADKWEEVSKVSILWYSKNRIPHPGGWFTNKAKAWGGVSRDLMPHLVNEFQILLFRLKYDSIPEHAIKTMKQVHTLESAQASGTEYGECYNGPGAIYDVDDEAHIWLEHEGVEISVYANWKTDDEDFVGIKVAFKDGSKGELELGLCPNRYFGNMIDDITQADQDSQEAHERIDLDMLKTLEGFTKI